MAPFLADLSIGLPYDRIMSYDPADPGMIITGLTVGELPDLANSGQLAKGYVFFATNRGLGSLPVPRVNLPPTDFWSTSTFNPAPNLQVQYTGAPAFANLPGPIPTAGPFSPGGVSSHLYAGGIAGNAPFGSPGGNGRIVAFDVQSRRGPGGM